MTETDSDTTTQPAVLAREIDRCSHLSESDFRELYLAGEGLPVVVTDATDTWAARDKWTFDFFARRFGQETVIVTDRLGQAKAARKVSFADYITYCQVPAFSPLSRAGSEFPFYLTTFSPFAQHPELLEDFCAPYFVKNIYLQLTGGHKNWYLDGFSWIFIGPKGTLSPYHVDLFGTHAWLAQLKGTKEFTLVPPPHGEARQTALKCILQPGEVIFIPAGWAHQVVSLEPSISVTFNFVDESNYMRHILAISKDLPLWVKKLGKSGFPQANKHDWISKGFDTAGLGER